MGFNGKQKLAGPQVKPIMANRYKISVWERMSNCKQDHEGVSRSASSIYRLVILAIRESCVDVAPTLPEPVQLI